MATTFTTTRTYGWRVVDIVVAAVLGVATGIIFVGWNFVGGAGYEVFNAATPGLGGLAVGIWLLGGVLGGLIIRKPGAALAVELLAALVSAAVGNQWGITTLYSGLAQGIGGANGIGTYGPAVASQIPTVLESGSDSACLARSPCWCHIRGAGTAKRIHHFPCPSSRVWSSRCRPRSNDQNLWMVFGLVT
jgi:energy-coupling factor transport system permease protein